MKNYSMRNAIERAILSTILYRDLTLEKDFNQIVDYEIDYKLFKSNTTCKAVAKAIYNQGLNPFDEETILRYISKHMDLNHQEWSDIICATPLSYDMLIKNTEELKLIEREEMIKELRNGR